MKANAFKNELKLSFKTENNFSISNENLDLLGTPNQSNNVFLSK